ncbi:GatB/YqeY domain-containing protein [Pseudomonas sp. MWU12-2534b]|nr:GatB/YqeY domain-containing protein [Pseudomonas sp. MWU12-2534b]
MSLKEQISEDMKAAMRAKESERLATIRLLMAAIKQREVDDQVTLDDAGITAVIDKMIKQRRDSISQYQAAQRQDLVDKEQAEMDVLMAYMPQQLSQAEIEALIAKAVADTGAGGMQDMGKVMGALRPQLAGRADMAQVSALIKAKLSA